MDRETEDLLEALVNLLYLIRHSADDPEAVCEYADIAESAVAALRASEQYTDLFAKPEAEYLSDGPECPLLLIRSNTW